MFHFMNCLVRLLAFIMNVCNAFDIMALADADLRPVLRGVPLDQTVRAMLVVLLSECAHFDVSVDPVPRKAR